MMFSGTDGEAATAVTETKAVANDGENNAAARPRISLPVKSSIVLLLVVIAGVAWDLYPNLSWHWKKEILINTIGQPRTDALEQLNRAGMKARWMPYSSMLMVSPKRRSFFLEKINWIIYERLKPESYEKVSWVINTPFAILGVDSTDAISAVEFGY